MPTLYEYIKSDATLLELASRGCDADIVNILNTVSDSILVNRKYIPADYVRAMSIIALNTAAAGGDSDKITRWTIALQMASGFNQDILFEDPLLQAQLALALNDEVLSTETYNYYTKRKASISEKEWGRFITLDEVSNVLLIDRPDGKLVI